MGLGEPKMQYFQDKEALILIAFMYEFIGTFFLVFIIFGLGVHQKQPATVVGFGVGAYIIVAVLSFGKWTGACMNPARVIGPAFMNGDLFKNGFWVYYSATLAGGIAGGVLYDFIILKSQDELTPDDYRKAKDEHKIVKGYGGKKVEKREIELTVWEEREDLEHEE